MSSVRKKQDLDHSVWKLLKQQDLTQKKFLVAFSGGIDSLALLCILRKILPIDSLGACYFHHGEGSNQEYRDKAEKFCRETCEAWGISFYSLKTSKKLKTEAQYREHRYEALRSLKSKQGYDLIATAHHRDDLLETRILRLIRGTGGQGLEAMNVCAGDLVRPLLEMSKSELSEYLKKEKLRGVNDPSNRDLDPLRNWLRGRWLKALERHQPGSLKSLSRSLQTIAGELQQQAWGDLLSLNESYGESGIHRGFYLTLKAAEQRRLLAQYLFALGKRDFSQAQLEEIQKRLDKSQNVITFKVGGCQWEVNAQQIKVQS